MKIETHMYGYKPDGTVGMIKIPNQIPVLNFNFIISIDGSTTCTGVSLVETTSGGVCYSMALHNDCKDPVKYKVELKDFLYKLFSANMGNIKVVGYEEPFFGYAQSSKILMMLRTSAREVVLEHKELTGLITIEVPNQRWKKIILAPEKVPCGTENQKEAVKRKIVSFMPDYNSLMQDECDSYGVGYCIAYMLNQGLSFKDIVAKKKIKPFKINLEFIGFEDAGEQEEEIVISDIYNGRYKIPARVLDNGCDLAYADGKGKLVNKICELIGEEDIVGIVGFNTKKYGSIAVEYDLGDLFNRCEYIYAIGWRKTRKY